jgi:SAM-dependent methyltransferase
MELTDLHFDLFQRYDIILRIVRLLKPASRARILDVGGYPGTLLDFLPEHFCITADTVHCPRDQYVRASGCALPFTDKTFDIVVSSDTLEHVDPAERENFVRETIRLARSFAIIAAPFDSPAVRLADDKIAELHQLVFGKPHDWLSQHMEQGLPRTQWLSAYLGAAGLPYATLSNGYLITWFLLRGLETVLMMFPNASQIASEMHPVFNRLWAQSEPGEPSYRKVFLISTTAEPLPAEVLQRLHDPARRALEESHVTDKLQAINDLLCSLVKTISDAFADPNRLGATTTTQYIKQLENATHFHEEEVKKLRNVAQTLSERLARYDRHPLVRILRKLHLL